MALQSSQRLPELLFYTKKSYKILQAPIPAPIPASILHVHITENSTCRRQRALRVLQSSSRNSMHRRQGDLLEMHPCVLQDIQGNSSCSRDIQGNSSCSRDIQDIPVIHDLPAFQAILQCSSISRESTPFQHFPIRMHILQFDWFPQKLHRVPVGQLQTLQTLHSKKGRCCDIGQDVKMTYFLE